MNAILPALLVCFVSTGDRRKADRPYGQSLGVRGVRVFSLAESTKNVDAFSCWRNDEPYVFLNTFKSAVGSPCSDAAHELAHLVLHRHGGPQQGRQAEQEAHTFAASFLMPHADVVATIPFVASLDQLVREKKRWGVSVLALAYLIHKMRVLSDWQYRTFCIQINRKYRDSEPNGLPQERSSIWQMVLTELWKEGIPRRKPYCGATGCSSRRD